MESFRERVGYDGHEAGVLVIIGTSQAAGGGSCEWDAYGKAPRGEADMQILIDPGGRRYTMVSE